MIPLNGSATTLLIPAIIVFTTFLNADTIPSVIPENILPPVEKTFLTPFQALVNIFLKNDATDEKIFLIPFQAF